jgi:hypothetical protein
MDEQNNKRVIRISHRNAVSYSCFLDVVNNGTRTYNEDTNIISWTLFKDTNDTKRAGERADLYIISYEDDHFIKMELTDIDKGPISRSYHTGQVIDTTFDVYMFAAKHLDGYYSDDILEQALENLSKTTYEIV